MFITSLLVLYLGLTFSHAQDSPCEQRSDPRPGICVQARECHDVDLRTLNICGFDGYIPFVCCPVKPQVQVTVPDPRNPEPENVDQFTQVKINQSNYQQHSNLNSGSPRISEKKCSEYTGQVTRLVVGLHLTADSEPVVKTAPKCNFYNNVQLIVGGEKAELGEFPHMAALGYGPEPYEFLICGGTLISDWFVLTAAHCINSLQWGRVRAVRLGEHDLSRDDDGAHPVDVAVSEVIRHPGYNPSQKYHDVALLRLTQRVNFNSRVRPACLATRSPPTLSKAVATGWGRVERTGEQSPVLLKVLLELMDHGTCSRYFSSHIRSFPAKWPLGLDFSSMLCAGDSNGGKDTCQGDSGGPLTVASKENICIHHLIGITSFGISCGFTATPAIYMRISNYVPWIESVVWPQEV